MHTELRFESHGCRLFAVDTASGTVAEPFVFLHGGLATHLAALHVASTLQPPRTRVVAPDLRASGRSHFAGALSWDLFADDIAALVAHLGVPRVALGGVSFGAGVAVAAALRHPQLVSELVLVHPAYGGPDIPLTDAQQAAFAAMDAAGALAAREGIEALFPLFDNLPAALRERVLPVIATYDPASVAALTRFMASGAQPFARAGDLAAITAPTTIVPGTNAEHPAEVAALYARHIPRCTLVEPPR